MIKKWLQKATDAVASSKSARSEATQAQDTGPLILDSPIPPAQQQLDLIVVPQSAMDMVDNAPQHMCDAVFDYVSHLLEVGYYTPSEIPSEAMWGYQLAFYQDQVEQGGHRAFFDAAQSTLSATVQDLMSGAMAMGHDGYHALFSDLAAWAAQVSVSDVDADDLAAFDARYDALNDADPLQSQLGLWIAQLEITLTVPDDTLGRVYEGILLMNDKKAPRETSANMIDFDFMLTDPGRLGFGHVAGILKAPLIAVGNGSTQSVDGENKLAWLLLTNAGKAWGVEGEHGCELRHYIEDAQGVSVGDSMGFASHEKIAVARKVAKQTNAAAALDLCLQGLPRRAVVDHLSVRSAGLGKDDVVGASIYVVANKGSQAFTLVVTAEGAKLLEEPSHIVLTSATRAEIAAHAKANTNRIAA